MPKNLAAHGFAQFLLLKEADGDRFAPFRPGAEQLVPVFTVSVEKDVRKGRARPASR